MASSSVVGVTIREANKGVETRAVQERTTTAVFWFCREGLFFMFALAGHLRSVVQVP